MTYNIVHRTLYEYTAAGERVAPCRPARTARHGNPDVR